MALDVGFAISISVAGIIATTGLLAIINILMGRSKKKNNHTKTSGLAV